MFGMKLSVLLCWHTDLACNGSGWCWTVICNTPRSLDTDLALHCPEPAREETDLGHSDLDIWSLCFVLAIHISEPWHKAWGFTFCFHHMCNKRLWNQNTYIYIFTTTSSHSSQNSKASWLLNAFFPPHHSDFTHLTSLIYKLFVLTIKNRLLSSSKIRVPKASIVSLTLWVND